ncbi:embryonic polyadenylate-binding protein 2 [Bombina bombina]|uniref:embryonic polyadenylate-binding protein 2 n=1 Tax=Bombina bombina TaxID=8345 RepID=UPI00235A9227|nr:embryonic polyadenylate-binding protein 2 [Bombina bombina]
MTERHTGELELGEGDQTETSDIDELELNAIKMRVREMEEEAERLKGLSGKERTLVVSPMAGMTHIHTYIHTYLFPNCPPRPLSVEEKKEADRRSVYVGNVDYGGTAQDLESHFSGCGSINRITILCDKFSGHPKGYAYIEFAERNSVEAAIAMDETVFRGRIIKVLPKRTNMPGISTTDRGGFRGRSRGPRGNFVRGPRVRGRGGFSLEWMSYYFGQMY